MQFRILENQIIVEPDPDQVQFQAFSSLLSTFVLEKSCKFREPFLIDHSYVPLLQQNVLLCWLPFFALLLDLEITAMCK
jgi:hypothetical protein